MWNRDLKAQLACNYILDDVEEAIKDPQLFSPDHALSVLHELFPNLTETELIYLFNIIIHIYNSKNGDNTSLVATLPSNYNIQALPTISVITELIESAQEIIMITGYSISDYANDLLEKIINKSKSGVMVKLFVNKFDPTESQIINKLDIFKGRYLEIYRYSEKEDNMAALHAKVLMIDNKKSLITSANLSFHGLEKNIELGCLIESASYSQKLHILFSELIKTYKVKKVY